MKQKYQKNLINILQDKIQLKLATIIKTKGNKLLVKLISARQFIEARQECLVRVVTHVIGRYARQSKVLQDF